MCVCVSLYRWLKTKLSKNLNAHIRSTDGILSGYILVLVIERLEVAPWAVGVPLSLS